VSDRACVFDAYGTLFDVHSAVARHAAEIGPSAPALSQLWRQKQLEYTWTRSLMRRHADFWTVTGEALDVAMRAHAVESRTLREKLMQAYLALDAYPEVKDVLTRLKRMGVRTGILSNGSPAMLEAAVKSAALDQVLDDIFSVDMVQRFKPDPAVYDLVTTGWRLYPSSVSFQSSNRWDVAGATKFGFRTVWINRGGQPDEYRDFPPSMILPSLEGLLSA